MRLLSLEDAAQRLNLSTRSLVDKRFRTRLGLPAVKIGRRVVFDERDIEQIILRGRESLPQSRECVGTASENHA